MSTLDKHKKSDSSKDREKASPASSVGSNISAGDNGPIKSSFKPYENHGKEGSPEDRGSANSRERTPSSKSSSNTPAPVNGNRCNSNHSSSSPRSSPVAVNRKTPASSSESTSTSKTVTTQSTAVPRSVPSPPSKIGFSPSLLSSASDPLLKDLPLGTFKPGAGLPLPTGLLSGYPPPGGPFPIDVMASSFLSPHALKGGLNPYLNYARMKSATGSDSLVPVCRDPYCTGCQLSSHLLPSAGGKPSPCPGGCAQCDHTSKPSGFLPTSTGTAAAAAYAHAQLAALAAASQLPYVCNWIAGDAAYCGKRFSNSEELLQHLKTHTSISNSDNSNSSSLSLLSPPGLPPTLPLLHRTYPTPPISPLATARYHPYSKGPLLSPSFSSLGFPLHPHPSLTPYLSPYALYGQRLGASGMHP